MESISFFHSTFTVYTGCQGKRADMVLALMEFTSKGKGGHYTRNCNKIDKGRMM